LLLGIWESWNGGQQDETYQKPGCPQRDSSRAPLRSLIWIKLLCLTLRKPLAPLKSCGAERAPGRENLDLGEPTGSKSNPGRVATAHVQAVIG
jgi:hypothetical protein